MLSFFWLCLAWNLLRESASTYALPASEITVANRITDSKQKKRLVRQIKNFFIKNFFLLIHGLESFFNKYFFY